MSYYRMRAMKARMGLTSSEEADKSRDAVQLSTAGWVACTLGGDTNDWQKQSVHCRSCGEYLGWQKTSPNGLLYARKIRKNCRCSV